MIPRADRLSSHLQTEGLTLFVDVFFVISGFIIAYIYAERLKDLKSFGRFMQRRIARLMPLHIVTLIFMTTFYAAILSMGIVVKNEPSLSAYCLSSAAFLVHSWNNCGTTVPNGVSWSVSAELAAYLLFPLCLFCLRAPRLVRILLLCVLTFGCAQLSGGIDQLSLSFTAIRALPGFYFGSLLYVEREAIHLPDWAGVVPFGLIILLCVGSFFVWSREILFCVAYGIAASAILVDTSGIKSRIVSFFAPLGQLTFSIYMLHSIFITILVSAFADKILHLNIIWLTMVTMFTWILILIASLISFSLFEGPCRKLIDGLEIFGKNR